MQLASPKSIYCNNYRWLKMTSGFVFEANMKINLHLVSISIFSVASFYLLIGNALAGNNSYTCEVKHVYRLSEKGELENVSSLEQAFRNGGSFSINKKSGRITGNAGISTPLHFSTEVIWLGGKGNSFQAIATGNGTVETIQVNEFVDGDEKPFVNKNALVISTGLCK